MISYRYITGIIRERGHKLLAINGMPDHIHILIGTRPDVPLSGLVRDIKSFSSRFINQKGWVRGNFQLVTVTEFERMDTKQMRPLGILIITHKSHRNRKVLLRSREYRTLNNQLRSSKSRFDEENIQYRTLNTQ